MHLVTLLVLAALAQRSPEMITVTGVVSSERAFCGSVDLVNAPPLDLDCIVVTLDTPVNGRTAITLQFWSTEVLSPGVNKGAHVQIEFESFRLDQRGGVFVPSASVRLRSE